MNILEKRYWFLPILIFMVGCETEKEEPGILNSVYFPLEIGNFWTYEVEESIYFGENDFETHQFFYRDEITDQYVNEENDPVFLFKRQTSPDRNNWKNKMVFAYTFSGNRLIRTYDNLQEIVLVYPVEDHLEWDGNGLNNRLSENFFIENRGSYSLKDKTYPNTVSVRQSNEDDRITIRDIRYEVFAENIGMVESYYEVYSYCSRNDCLGEQIIQKGRFTHLKLISNGKI